MARALALALAAGFLTMTCVAAFSQGSMGRDVNVIRVSPSISYYGDSRKQKQFESREAVKLNSRMILEEQKQLHKRQLEADKAYYKKLEAQRKGK